MFRKTGKILMSEKLSNFRGVGKTVRGRLKAAIQNLFSYLKKIGIDSHCLDFTVEK